MLSTARSWIRRGLPENVITLRKDDDSSVLMHLRIRARELNGRVLAAEIRLLRTLIAVARPTLDLS